MPLAVVQIPQPSFSFCSSFSAATSASARMHRCSPRRNTRCEQAAEKKKSHSARGRDSHSVRFANRGPVRKSQIGAQPWSMRLTHWHVDGPVRDSASRSSPKVVPDSRTLAPGHLHPRALHRHNKRLDGAAAAAAAAGEQPAASGPATTGSPGRSRPGAPHARLYLPLVRRTLSHSCLSRTSRMR